MNDRRQESLDRLIANLPKDIVPPGNLWPGIAARLTGRTRRAPPMALAAAIAMAAAGLASFFTWAVLQSRTVPAVVQTAAAKNSFEEPRDPKYVLARDAVEKTFRERLEMLAACDARKNRSEFGGHSKGARRHPQGAGRRSAKPGARTALGEHLAR